ncbi:MAG: zinc ribbon domain-containing protein [bacterium]|nr:zinc ribbon domain-containing protein [bacterium]
MTQIEGKIEGNPMFCTNCGVQLTDGANFCHKCGKQYVPGNDITRVAGLSPVPDENEVTKEIVLCHVYSIVNNFRYKDILYDNVKINWFMMGRGTPQIPFEAAILRYDRLDIATKIHPENYLLERFTREEAQMLKLFLNSAQKTETVIEEIKLPITESEKGYRATPAGRGTDFIQLHKKGKYSLPFKVEGIFNVRIADERIVADDNVTIVSRNISKQLETLTQKKEAQKKKEAEELGFEL